MLTIHHLGHSQSERILWPCEELAIPYDLKRCARSGHDPGADLRALHPLGAAPIIEDDGVVCDASANGPPTAARWRRATPI